mmetsp:Transcript_128534/g.227656  ORF Transcript_128534/g.227656 Transcript_128534/m.227656 type:complete len:298 (-) Transcript_128534:36-929(-)
MAAQGSHHKLKDPSRHGLRGRSLGICENQATERLAGSPLKSRVSRSMLHCLSHGLHSARRNQFSPYLSFCELGQSFTAKSLHFLTFACHVHRRYPKAWGHAHAAPMDGQDCLRRRGACHSCESAAQDATRALLAGVRKPRLQCECGRIHNCQTRRCAAATTTSWMRTAHKLRQQAASLRRHRRTAPVMLRGSKGHLECTTFNGFRRVLRTPSREVSQALAGARLHSCIAHMLPSRADEAFSTALVHVAGLCKTTQRIRSCTHNSSIERMQFHGLYKHFATANVIRSIHFASHQHQSP